MAEYRCKSCGLPLRILSGGMKTAAKSTKITIVHILGCLNKNCPEFQKQQMRVESKPQESFEG